MSSDTGTNRHNHIFTGVDTFGASCAFVRGVLRELDEKRVPHAFTMRFVDNRWSRYIIHNNVTSQCTISEPIRTTLSLCYDGTVHVDQEGGASWIENLDPSGDGPNTLRWMWEIRAIGKHVYAVGMRRMIYRRGSDGTWLRFNLGAEARERDQVDVGFRSIDGFSEEEIVAVGLHGEMWVCKEQAWSQLESPTNVRLERIRFASADVVYACGGAGVILRRTNNQWLAIKHDVTDETFWDLAVFQGRLFFATSESLYELSEADELSKVQISSTRRVATHYLAASTQRLWSVGGTDIATFDGDQWQFPQHPLSAKA